MHSRATFVERIPFPRVTLDAPFSTRNSSRKREKKRVSSEAGGGDLWMKIVGETGAETRIFRARIDRLSDFYPIFVSCAFTWFISGNLITFSISLIFLEQSLLRLFCSYEFIVGQFLFREKRNLTRLGEILEELKD